MSDISTAVEVFLVAASEMLKMGLVHEAVDLNACNSFGLHLLRFLAKNLMLLPFSCKLGLLLILILNLLYVDVYFELELLWVT